MTDDQLTTMEERFALALEKAERRARASRRRERAATFALVLLAILMRTGWPLSAQPTKTIEERIKDLEKRSGGIMQMSDGRTVVTAPFEVLGAKNNVLMRVTGSERGGLLQIGNPDDGARVIVGVSEGGTGEGQVTVIRSNDKIMAAMGKLGSTSARGFHIFDDGDQVAAQLVFTDTPALMIGQESSGGGRMSIGASGTGFLSLRNETGAIQVHAGRIDKRPAGLYLSAKGDVRDSQSVSIYGDALGGNVRVSNVKGVPVGGLFSEDEGGGLVLTGPGGGDSVVDLGIRAGGGSVRVFSEGGGPTRAALEADARTGGITAFAGDGRPAATLSSMPGGSGRIQLATNGVTVVEAGATTDGVGLVRAGPAGCRTVGALAQPCRIVGTK